MMSNFEEEFAKIEPIVNKLCDFFLFGKKIVTHGSKNFVKEGPNIIVGNHIGTFKDVALLFKIVSRPIFFTANKMIFTKKDFNFLIRKHFKRHMKDFGLFLDLILKPVKAPLVNFISTNIAKVGGMPVDLDKKKSLAIKKCQDYLKEGRIVILLQGRGRVMDGDPNPYVCTFRKGASAISYNLYKKEGISVPVTPLAMFGTHLPFLVPAKIRVNVGKPMYITDYLEDGFAETIARFRTAMEKRVKSLFYEIIHLDYSS